MRKYELEPEPFTIGYLFSVVKGNIIGDIGAETFLNTLVWSLEPLLPAKANPNIDKNTAYLIRDQKSEFNADIKIATNSEESVVLLSRCYKEKVLPRLPAEVRGDMKYQLLQSFQADALMNPSKKDELQRSLSVEPLETALARITRYLIARKNCLSASLQTSPSFHKKKLPFLSPIPILPLPDIIQKREIQVVRALLLVYSEYDRVPYTMEQIGHLSNWDFHLSQQRQAFQTIFTLREQMKRLITPDLPAPFEHLCNEMFNGIFSTYMKPHHDGYHCLCEVLEKAQLLPLDAVSAIQETSWIGTSQRLGLCHYLIYKKKLPGWIPPLRPFPLKSVS